MIAIIDYDIGNLLAVSNMLQRIGVTCEITNVAAKIECADKIILPGNGAFDACVKNLRASGLIPLLEQKILYEGTPLLGICVGAQMLGISSEEGDELGLGWLDMRVRRFPVKPNYRVPHMGWCHVYPPSGVDHVLTKGMDEETRFYFIHSFYMELSRSSDVLLYANYGIEFAACVCKKNIVGVQFHPEKSHRFGKQLLAQFARYF